MSKKENTVERTITVEARAYPITEPKGNTLAFASVTIDGMFAVNGIRVMDSEKGRFAAMPSAKDKNGTYRDVCFPITADLRKQLNAAVLDAYDQALTQEKASVRDQIKEGPKAVKEKPAPDKENSAKKSVPEL